MPGVAGEQRFAEFVRRIMALRESTALHVIEDLMPVLPVLDASAPELAYLRRERWCAGYVEVTSGAANYAQVGITNPAGSGRLAVLESMTLRGSAGLVIGRVLSLPLAFGAVTTSVQNTDGRGCTDSVTPPPIAQLGSRDLAIAITAFMQFGENGGYFEGIVRGIVLPPGWQFLLSRATTGVATLGADFRWRERFVDPSELNATGA